MRLADERDTSAIRSAVHNYAEQPACDWVLGLDVDKANAALADWVATGKAYVIDGYLVLVDEATPWYSNSTYLDEWFVLKLYPGGSLDSIPPALARLAKQRGCVAVMGGDSSPAKRLDAAYRRAPGWVPAANLHFRKI